MGLTLHLPATRHGPVPLPSQTWLTAFVHLPRLHSVGRHRLLAGQPLPRRHMEEAGTGPRAGHAVVPPPVRRALSRSPPHSPAPHAVDGSAESPADRLAL